MNGYGLERAEQAGLQDCTGEGKLMDIHSKPAAEGGREVI